MNLDNKYKGLITKKFNSFYLVQLNRDDNKNFKNRILCKIKKSLNFRNQLVFVGDEVIVEQIDLKTKRGTIQSVVKRNNL